MDFTATEQTVMRRFADKTHMAGGAKAGYVLRRQAIVGDAGADADFEGAITALGARGLLTLSEGGEFVYLTAAGVDALAGKTASGVASGVETPAAHTPAAHAPAADTPTA